VISGLHRLDIAYGVLRKTNIVIYHFEEEKFIHSFGLDTPVY